jgi:hypothetical protein
MDPIGASPTWRWHGYDNSWVIVVRWIRGGAFTNVVHTVLEAMGVAVVSN